MGNCCYKYPDITGIKPEPACIAAWLCFVYFAGGMLHAFDLISRVARYFIILAKYPDYIFLCVSGKALFIFIVQ